VHLAQLQAGSALPKGESTGVIVLRGWALNRAVFEVAATTETRTTSLQPVLVLAAHYQGCKDHAMWSSRTILNRHRLAIPGDSHSVAFCLSMAKIAQSNQGTFAPMIGI